jgi:hypothetical protein
VIQIPGKTIVSNSKTERQNEIEPEEAGKEAGLDTIEEGLQKNADILPDLRESPAFRISSFERSAC